MTFSVSDSGTSYTFPDGSSLGGAIQIIEVTASADESELTLIFCKVREQ